jgi:hypothetical protein
MNKKHYSRVCPYFRLEIKQNSQNYPNMVQSPSGLGLESNSFYFIMVTIATFLGVNLNSRQRILNDKLFSSYIVTAYNKNSFNKLIEYFAKFPLKSSKYLDLLEWLKIVKLISTDKASSSPILLKANEIRKDFNKTRKTFSWNHLISK